MISIAAAQLLVVYWYVLLFLSKGTQGIPSFQVHPSNSGIVFERLENILYVPHQAIITTRLNLTIFEEEEARLQDTIEALVQREMLVQGINLSRPVRLYKDLIQIVRNSCEQLRGITATIPQRRVKRAWISAGGTILKTIFGTPDHADATRWNTEIHRAMSVTQEMQAALAHQQIRLTHIEDNLVASTRQLQATATQVAHQIDKISNTVNRDVTMIQQTLSNLTTTLESTRMIQILLYNAQSVQLHINELHTAIQWGLQHRLSPYFLSAPLFLGVLKNISAIIKAPAREIYPVRKEYLSLYYAAVQVSLLRRREGLDIEIHLPITCHACEMESYRLHSFPVMWKAVGQHLLWKTADILAVSPDRHMHTVLSDRELERCAKPNNYLCSNLTLSTDLTTCEIALFLAEANTSSCQRSVTQLKTPKFISIANSHVYAVPNPITVSLVCYTKEIIPQTYRVTLINSGLLINSSHCDIITPTIKIAAQLNYRTTTQIKPFLLHLPEVSVAVPASDQLEKAPHFDHTQLRHSLNNLITREQGQISLDRALTHIRDWNSEQHRLTVVIPSIALPPTALFVIILIMYFMYRKGYCKRRRPITNTVPGEQANGHFNRSDTQ